jgi:hypothetical protein
MKTLLSIIGTFTLALLLVGRPALAQTGYEPTPAELRKSIVKMKVQANTAQKQVHEMQGELVDLDKNFERRVSDLIALLSETSDSTASGTRVIRTKEDVLDGLKNSIQFYVREREKRQAELQKPYRKLSAEELQEDISSMNEKIDGRVDQIIQLTSSLTGHKGFKKYETYRYNGRGGRKGNRNNNYKEGRVISDEYKQNERVSGKTANRKEELVDGLQKSIAHLEKEGAELRERLSRAESKADWDATEALLKESEERLAERHEQVRKTMYDDAPDSKALGSDAAHALNRKVNESMEALRTDFLEMVRLKNRIDVERSRVRWLNTRVGLVSQQLQEELGTE